MKSIISDTSSREQTIAINELLSLDETYYSKQFLLSLLFKLPYDITYKGVRGYLSIGPLGIEYTSLSSSYKVNVVFSSSIVPNKDLYDCFIETLEFFYKNIDDIELNEVPDDCLIEK